MVLAFRVFGGLRYGEGIAFEVVAFNGLRDGLRYGEGDELAFKVVAAFKGLRSGEGDGLAFKIVAFKGLGGGFLRVILARKNR